MIYVVAALILDVRKLIEYVDDGDGHLRCPQCGRTSGHAADCWLGNAIAQSERLKDWQPKVGDRVRLKAMPETGTWKVLEISEGSLGMKASLVSTSNKRREMLRYPAELMPEEGE